MEGLNDTKKTFEKFTEYKEIARKAFKGEFDLIYAVCASILLSHDKKTDIETLKECKKMIKDNTGVFSGFRGSMYAPAACMLSLYDDPAEKINTVMKNYGILKDYFPGGEHMALVSLALTETAPFENVRVIAERGKAIYDTMKEKHRFLTGREDSVFAILMALSGKSDDELIEDDEKCFELLKPIAGKDVIQTVSHILSMSEGDVNAKCSRFGDLFDSLKNAGMKYGKTYELPVLASLAVNTDTEISKLVNLIEEADFFLSGQTGYKGIFGVDKRTRLMHAVMLVSSVLTPGFEGNSVAAASMITAAAAQMLATIVVISCTTATVSAVVSN